MIITKNIIVLISISILASCRHGYIVENGKVYYEYWNEGSGQGRLYIKMADAKTFQILEFDCDCNFEFGRDKDHLFIDGEPIRHIDPNSFKFIGNYVFADKDSAYFFGFYNNINDCAIRGIEQDKLQLIEYPWSKAGRLLIHGSDTLSIDDIDDFKPLDEYWGRTKKYVIYENHILNGADPESFKIINDYTGKDRNNTYEFGEIKK